MGNDALSQLIHNFISYILVLCSFIQFYKNSFLNTFSTKYGDRKCTLFNVSSTGATATVWLAQVLNAHPQTAHALRSDPFSSKEKYVL